MCYMLIAFELRRHARKRMRTPGGSLSRPLPGKSKHLLHHRQGRRPYKSYGKKPEKRHTKPVTHTFGPTHRVGLAFALAAPLLLGQWLAL